MLKFAVAIFAGAFLLFQVQPLIGKYILPWFGGTPAVWTTCMLFFQWLLLGGYAYAHLSTSRLRPRRQAVLHLVLLVLAVSVLPVTPSEAWKPSDSSHPSLRIMALLMVTVGLPYFVLSATGPLLQEWFRQTHPGRSPFRLYALSNLGSLLALVSYPFWFEIHFSRHAQAVCWSWGMACFALVCGYCAVSIRRTDVAPVPRETPGTEDGPRPGVVHYLLWLALPACASVLLLATTNKLCQDVAVIPFLWVLPLALYLLTFIISFDSPRWYSRAAFGMALLISLAAAAWALSKGGDLPIREQVIAYGSALFVCGMVCHGELYRLKPSARYLTTFYLMIALGGALGGLFVAILAPLVFNTYVEFQWGLGLCLFLFLIVCARDRAGLEPSGWRALTLFYGFAAWVALDRGVAWVATWLKGHHSELGWPWLAQVNWARAGNAHWMVWIVLAIGVAWLFIRRHRLHSRPWHLPFCALLTVAACALSGILARQSWAARLGATSTTRNFYGVLSIWEYQRDNPDEHYLLLQHGRITHGIQFVDPANLMRATTYYGENSGVGLALRQFPRQKDRVIGVVGLGTGTLAAYGKPGDRIRFYEINPEVERLARNRFSYLEHCPARVEVALGDARLSLEREAAQQFDVLALDAFSSDSIPVHLLTREAFEIYLRHLKPDGVIAVHISNHYLNLAPVVESLAAHFRLKGVSIAEEEGDFGDDSTWWHYASTWVLLTRNEAFLQDPAIRDAKKEPVTPGLRIPLWTDDHASLFPILQ